MELLPTDCMPTIITLKARRLIYWLVSSMGQVILFININDPNPNSSPIDAIFNTISHIWILYAYRLGNLIFDDDHLAQSLSPPASFSNLLRTVSNRPMPGLVDKFPHLSIINSIITCMKSCCSFCSTPRNPGSNSLGSCRIRTLHRRRSFRQPCTSGKFW